MPDTEILSTRKLFTWPDYVVLIGSLAISTLIGLYHGYKGRKNFTTGEFSLGGRKMGIFPVSMSLLAR